MLDKLVRRVTLRTFRGTTIGPEDQSPGDDFWRLIGRSGSVVEFDDGAVGRLASGPRVLVQFDDDPAELGLSCHNLVARALWIRASDLEAEHQA